MYKVIRDSQKLTFISYFTYTIIDCKSASIKHATVKNKQNVNKNTQVKGRKSYVNERYDSIHLRSSSGPLYPFGGGFGGGFPRWFHNVNAKRSFSSRIFSSSCSLIVIINSIFILWQSSCVASWRFAAAAWRQNSHPPTYIVPRMSSNIRRVPWRNSPPS